MNDSTSNNIFVRPLPWVEPHPLDIFPPQAPEPVPVDGLLPAVPSAVESLEDKEDGSLPIMPASALTSSLTSDVIEPKINRTPPPLPPPAPPAPSPAPYPGLDLPEVEDIENPSEMQDDDPLAPDLVPISAFPAEGEGEGGGKSLDPRLYVIPSGLPQGDSAFELGNTPPSIEGEVQALGSISSIDFNGLEHFDDGVFLVPSSDGILP